MEYPTKKYMTGVEGAHRRAVYKAMGFTDEDLSRPLIAVVNSWGEVCPGHYGLNMLTSKVKEGVWQSGATPVEFGVISQCGTLTLGLDGIRYDLSTREVMSFEIETIVNSQMFDGIVFMTACDKVVPGMLIAAARLNLPSIVVCAGVMSAGELDGEAFSLSDLDEQVMGSYPVGKASAEKIRRMEEQACPTWGACPLMGTANTMQCLAEAVGLCLPGTSTMLATSSEILRAAKHAGNQIVELVKKGIKARDVMSREAVDNMIMMMMALGGSTNSVVHILSLAQELGYDDVVTLDYISEISRRTPCLVNVKPNGPYHQTDFEKCGGMPVVMQELRGQLHTGALTVTCATLGENLDAEEPHEIDRNVIYSAQKPISTDGGIAVLYGNLAPGGAILRQSARYRENLAHTGPAKVFDCQEDALEALRQGKISHGDVMVVRFEGPKGGPGMPDIYAVQASVCGMGLDKDVAVITDARFSGFARGFGVCQMTPEAAGGGPLAYLRDGDIIEIDVAGRRINALDGTIFTTRQPAPNPKDDKEYKGVLNLYKKYGGPANKGARLS
ncbi:MAG: dihydroxy-acid dehydratase [Clostridiales bacterium]|nr:dihydroxy-acid dehydratase [Clostridiales bacterium]